MDTGELARVAGANTHLRLDHMHFPVDEEMDPVADALPRAHEAVAENSDKIAEARVVCPRNPLTAAGWAHRMAA